MDDLDWEMHSTSTSLITLSRRMSSNNEKVPLWIAAIIVDMVVELMTLVLSVHMVWTLQIDYRQKTMATTLFCLRLL